MNSKAQNSEAKSIFNYLGKTLHDHIESVSSEEKLEYLLRIFAETLESDAIYTNAVILTSIDQIIDLYYLNPKVKYNSKLATLPIPKKHLNDFTKDSEKKRLKDQFKKIIEIWVASNLKIVLENYHAIKQDLKEGAFFAFFKKVIKLDVAEKIMDTALINQCIQFKKEETTMSLYHWDLMNRQLLYYTEKYKDGRILNEKFSDDYLHTTMVRIKSLMNSNLFSNGPRSKINRFLEVLSSGVPLHGVFHKNLVKDKSYEFKKFYKEVKEEAFEIIRETDDLVLILEYATLIKTFRDTALDKYQLQSEAMEELHNELQNRLGEFIKTM